MTRPLEPPADGTERHFYVRQMWDGKLSADLSAMPASLLPALLSALTLGSGDVFGRAMVGFAFAYAAQNERDYRSVVDALR
jgi:hypothetical protein